MATDLLPHLFRTEFSRIASVLCKTFGLNHIEIAEDLTSETFLAAMETWPHRGVPEDPRAWLYAVAKNKARNYLQHNNVFGRKVAPELRRQDKVVMEDIDLSETNIKDSQLQMLFAICHPAIANEAQIGLALRILCGFGIDEIATAFLTNRETVNKRLQRARDRLRTEKLEVRFPATNGEISARLGNVITTLYLLFSEGYYSESSDNVLREELCYEAMRLTRLLLDNAATDQPPVAALLSLMCFHASRFKARNARSGEVILYDEQDEALWDRTLIAKGAEYLHRASSGDEVSRYHLEAHIAWWHTHKSDTREKWDAILQLYNRLLMLEYSPVAALNRTYALFKVKGRELALEEALRLHMTNNRFYFLLLSELYVGIDNDIAQKYLADALRLSRSESERKKIQDRIDRLKQP
jgi:RNA polymerase sigma factor (sigma-70 family)